MDFLLRRESVKFRVFVGVLLVLFFSVCVSVSVYYGDALLLGSFEEFNNDDVKYLRSADTLLKTGKFTYENTEKSSVFIMPGIVFTLLPFVKIFDLEGAVLPFQIFRHFYRQLRYMYFFKLHECVLGKVRG